ncbi:MAG: NAD(P)/FAD-dependent oxidoreductase [Thermoplasmata archaeon]|nr:MAG: NAD(P)/FAD-dependent oxidoreductase [Thermoplasmata archaeon]KAA0016728.1 MAG: NAD(P)/FAD-dependent oxidoreductase [Thermoplasmata archaeon]
MFPCYLNVVKKNYDVLIIGAGAAGNAVASKIRNAETLVIEKKKIIGEPAECAGLVSKNCIDIMGFKDERFIQNEIYGAYIHSPEGQEYHIGGDKLHAYAIDRVEFDRLLAEKGKENGADYLLGVRAERVARGEKGITVKTKGEEFECNILVGAEGIDSITRRTFFGYEPEEVLFGIGAEVENIDVDPRNVHVFFGNKLAPGFFAWIIPTSRKGKSARIGLCTTYPSPYPSKKLLHNLLNYPTTRPFLENIDIIKVIAGRIPLGYIRESAEDNVMLIGDSAFQVKPVSGGGVYPIAISSEACAVTIEKALEEKNFSKRILKRYHEMWSSKLKKEIVLGMWVRRFFNKLKDDEIEKLLAHLKREDVIETINMYGDMDHPSKLILPLCRRIPSLLSLLPRFLTLF